MARAQQIGIRLESEIDPLENFSGDVHLLEMIVKNLLENAIQFRKPLENNPVIKLKMKNLGNQGLQITVEDNGIGMKPTIQQKMFDLFFRGHDAYKGAGLGLYIVKSAVDRLVGYIHRLSQPAQGTRFTATLPPM